jgi:phospholipid/cholesterol/gamma-HCH transport system substrate-binding protein
VLGSIQSQRGFERFMDYVFYQVAAINGFDSFGHYLRAGLIVNQCSTYADEPTPGCSAKFPNATATAATAGAEGPSDPVLKATAEAIARALRGETGASSERTGARSTPTPDAVPKLRATPSPSPSPSPAPSATPAPIPTPVAPAATPTPVPPSSTDEPLLDYLFGKDAG